MEISESKKAIHILTACLLIAASWFFFSPFEDTQWPKWMMMYWLGGAYFGYRIFKLTSRPELGLLFLSVSISAGLAAVDRRSYETYHLVSQIDIMGHSARAMVVFCFAVMFGLLSSSLKLGLGTLGLVGVSAVNQVLSLYQYWVLGNENWQSSGFLPNYSMASCMVSIVFPLALYQIFAVDMPKWWRPVAVTCVVTALPTIWMSQSSIGFASFAVMICAIVLGWGYIFARKHLLNGVIVCILFLASVWSVGRVIDPQWATFTQISRFKMWPAVFDFWLDKGSFWFGMGLGSFRHFGSVIQTQINVEVGHWWLWAHNDWLQVLFETGVIGLSATILVVVAAMWSALKACRIDLFASIVGICAVSAGNYPLRLAEFVIAVTIVMTAALKLPRARGFHWKNFYLHF